MIIGKEVLAIYDKYNQDFGLLDERWASVKDRKAVTNEQCRLFSEYIERLGMVQNSAYSPEMRKEAQMRIAEIERFMDREVAETLKKRIFG